MRILHTFESYDDHSGARAVKRLSEELALRGHSVAVATGQPARQTEASNGVSVHRFPIEGNSVRGVRGAKQDIESYLDFVVNYKPDILLNYAAQSWATDLLLPHLNQIKARKVFVPCGYSRLNDVRYQTYFAQLPQMLRVYDHIVYLSSNYADKHFNEASGVHRSIPYSIIPNSAEAREFRTVTMDFRATFGIKTRHLVIGVGNHYLAKNHPFFLRVAQKLRRNDVTFALIGKPSARPWRGCYFLCKTAPLVTRGLRVFDSLSREQVIAAYQAADLVLMTSRVECDPVVMYEAFASKTPLVATPVGSVTEFADLVQIVRSSEDALHAIHRLLSDAHRRTAAAERAYSRWESRHELGHMVDAYENLYTKLCV